MNDKIDLIIPWVDGNDPTWQTERNEWKSKIAHREKVDDGANSQIRYQSWDNLQYWFRAVEENIPWFNKIFFVTYGHLPKFLKTDHPKLQIVNHKDYIPQKYLPTFNSNTIEMNYYRIQDLSENFILFNDDFFPLQPIEETYYFQNNLVCDEAVETPIMPVQTDKNDTGRLFMCQVRINNLMFINRHFDKRQVQAEHYDKWFCKDYGKLLERNISLKYWNHFCGFHDPHVQSAMKKSTLKHLWDLEPDTLNAASNNKFRHASDVNQWLIRYWQICTGDFVPRRTLGKYSLVTAENVGEIARVIKNRSTQTICINEGCSSEEFERIKNIINSEFEKIFPKKSSFEI